MTDYPTYIDPKTKQHMKRSKKSLKRTIPKEEQHIHPYGKGYMKHKKPQEALEK